MVFGRWLRWIPTLVVLLGPVNSVAALPLSSAEGVWRTEGYGQHIEIQGNRLIRYEVTKISCLNVGEARQRSSQVSDGSLVFVGTASSGDFGGVLDVFHLIPGDTGDTRWLSVEGAISRIKLWRIDTLPASCKGHRDPSLLASYDVFWNTFAEHYPFFELKGVDWNAVNQQMRPRAQEAKNPRQLFEIFKQMLEPLHDAHTFVDARSLRLGFGGHKVNDAPLRPGDEKKIERMVRSKVVAGTWKRLCNSQLEFGLLEGHVGYLRIKSFAQYASSPRFETQRQVLDTSLDVIFSKAHLWRGLIIDVRINGGGSDVLATSIASRLTTAQYLAYEKVARIDPSEVTVRSAPQPAFVVPSPRKGFYQSVVLLTGIDSVSAAETFAMALMGRKPLVRRIGESTQGVFSDVLNRSLPNGWGLGVPNEIYLTADGTSFDGPGIPPDEVVSVFRADDIDTQTDPALERAMVVLRALAQ